MACTTARLINMRGRRAAWGLHGTCTELHGDCTLHDPKMRFANVTAQTLHSSLSRRAARA